MFSLPAHYHGCRRLALGAVMLAALSMCMIQVVEASHLHTTNDLPAQCIFSVGSTGAGLVSAIFTAAYSAVPVAHPEPDALPCIVRTVVLPPSRGPPSHF